MSEYAIENQLTEDYFAAFLMPPLDEQMAYDVERCLHAVLDMPGENVLKRAAVHVYKMGLLAGQAMEG